jgi:hypothetical protein
MKRAAHGVELGERIGQVLVSGWVAIRDPQFDERMLGRAQRIAVATLQLGEQHTRVGLQPGCADRVAVRTAQLGGPHDAADERVLRFDDDETGLRAQLLRQAGVAADRAPGARDQRAMQVAQRERTGGLCAQQVRHPALQVGSHRVASIPMIR